MKTELPKQEEAARLAAMRDMRKAKINTDLRPKAKKRGMNIWKKLMAAISNDN